MPIASIELPDWPRAHGEPLLSGRIKQNPEDFEVVEILGWTASGDGEHDFLWIEKIGQNTAWVAAQLGRHAGVPTRDVGFSGLKDRHAVTRQWFSVRRPSGTGTDWAAFDVDGVRILDIQRHGKKLKRGVHRMNRFKITIRDAQADSAALNERLSRMTSMGVPNYFGPQRFGRGARNLDLALALFDGRRMKRPQRSIAISTARSFLFNEVLAERIRLASWNSGMPGDCFNLDGTNSVFVPEHLDEETTDRVARLDIHPTGPLWGDGSQQCTDQARELEMRVLRAHPTWTDGLSAAGAKMARRALRSQAVDLNATILGPDVVLEFSLASGAYATSLLNELGSFDE